MAKNIFIISLLAIILTLLFIHYRYVRKTLESKDSFIRTLLSNSNMTDEDIDVMSNPEEKVKYLWPKALKI